MSTGTQLAPPDSNNDPSPPWDDPWIDLGGEG